MITNTEIFFVRAKQFQDKRAEIMDEYEHGVETVEKFRGSRGFDEELKRLQEKRDADLTELQEKYRSSFWTIFGGMMDAIGRRSMTAPTNAQLNLLQTLKLKKKVTLEECQRIAEAVKDNPLALGVVTEIARDNNLHVSFEDLCPEMSSERASQIVTNMKNSTEDFLLYDTTKASRLAKTYHENHYGDSTGSRLPKRKFFENKEGCFLMLAGLDREELAKFSKAVDGQGGEA